MAKSGGEVANLWVKFGATFADFQKDVAQVSKTLTKFQKQTDDAFGGLKKAAAGLGLAFGVRELTQGFTALINKGEELGSLKDNFVKLGGSAVQIEAAQRATLGLVSSIDLLKSANTGMLKQIPGFAQNFSQITELAARMADALGTDTKGAIEKVTDAFTSASDSQLKGVGILIDSELAYKNYKEQIKQTSGELTKAQKIEARQIEGLRQLQASIDRLAPVADSAANAQTRISVAMGEVLLKAGEAINQNKELQDTFNEIAAAISRIDWQSLVSGLSTGASAAKAFAQDVAEGISLLAQLGGLIGTMHFNKMSAADAKAANQMAVEMKAYGEAVDQVRSALVKLDTIQVGKNGLISGDELAKAKTALEKLEAAMASNKDANAAFGAQLRMARGQVALWSNNVEAAAPIVKKFGVQSEDALKKAADEAKKARDEINKLTESWTKAVQASDQDFLKDGIKASIDSLNQADFKALTDKLSKSVQDGFVEEWKEAIEKGAISPEEVKKQGAKQAEIMVAEYTDEFTQQSEQAYKDSVDTWRSLFENAITGVTFDLEDALKQVAVGFAADMAQGLLGSVGGLFGLGTSGISSAQDLGGMLAQQMIASYTGSAATSAATSGAVTATGEAAATAGTTGAAGGAAAGVSLGTMGIVAAAVLAAYATIDFAGNVYRNQNQEYDKYGTNNATSMAGRGIAAYMSGGFSELALAAMSSGTISNPNSQSRLGITGWIEDQLKGKNAMFYNPEGRLEKFGGDIKTGGTDKFNTPGWGDQFMASEGGATFAAVGEGLTKLLGVTEDVGAQIGMILSENLNGNLDNARMLMAELGISQEQLTEQFVMMGEEGAMSWHEVESSIQALAPAFQEGLTKVGDMVGAFDQLINSGGDGKDAIIAIKNSAIEAGEAGVKSFDEWKAALLAAGENPEMVDAFFQALSARGLDSLDKIKEASTRTIGGVVADMQTISPILAEQWIAAQQEAQKYLETLATIPDESEKHVTINVDANISEDAKLALGASGSSESSGTTDVPAFARGGIVTRPTLGLIGERGAEAIMPLSRLPSMMNSLAGKSGMGSGGNTYFLDLRGAAPGVETEVRRALREMEGEIVLKAMNATSNQVLRGGNYGQRFSE
jgi:hypothetical protein